METTSQKTFEDIQKDILARAIRKGACSDGKDDANNATNTIELLLVIKKYIYWLLKEKVIDADWLEDSFGTELLFANHIYTSGKHAFDVREANAVSFVALGTSNVTCKAWDTSNVTCKAWGTSNVTCKAWGTSNVTCEAWDTSNVTCKALGTSNVTCKAWDTSNVTCKAWGTSNVTCKAWDTSNVTCKAWDTSNVTCEAWDTSNVTCEALGTSNVTCGQYHSSKLAHSIGNGICPTIKHLTERKVYVKTSDFQIVQIN